MVLKLVAPASRRLWRGHPALAVRTGRPHDSHRDGGAPLLSCARPGRSETRPHTSLLLVFYIHVLGVDHAFVFLRLAIATRRSTRFRRRPSSGTRTRSCPRTSLGRLVHLLGQLVRSLGQTLARLVHGGLIVRLQRFLGVGNRVFHIAAFGARDLVALLAQHLLHAVNHGVELVAGLDLFAPGLVFGRVSFGVFRHALNFVLAQTARRRDRNFLVLARGHVFLGYV